MVKVFLHSKSNVYALACRIQEVFPEELAIDSVVKHGLFFISETLCSQKHPEIRLSRDQVNRFYWTVLSRDHRKVVIDWINSENVTDGVNPLSSDAHYDDIEEFFLKHGGKQKTYDDGGLPAFIFSEIETGLAEGGIYQSCYIAELWENLLQKPQMEFLTNALNNDTATLC